VEEDANGQERSRGRGFAKGQADAERRWQEHRHERTRSCKLLRHEPHHLQPCHLYTPLHSSNTIPSGSRKKTTATIQTVGIWLTIGNSKRMRICPLSSKGLRILACEMGSVKGMRKGAVVAGSKGMDMAYFVDMYAFVA